MALATLSMFPILLEDEFKRKSVVIVLKILYSLIILIVCLMLILSPILTIDQKIQGSFVNAYVLEDETHLLRIYDKDFYLEGVFLPGSHVVILEKIIFKRLSYPIEVLYDGPSDSDDYKACPDKFVIHKNTYHFK